MRKPEKKTAIYELAPGCSFSLRGVEIVNWEDNGTGISQPTDEQILAKQTELQTKYDSLAYARKRDAEYPSIKDQLDKIYHEGIDKWKEDMIKPVKDKHPKV